MNKRYFVELTAALALYAVLLFTANYLNAVWRPAGMPRILLALTPMIGAVAAGWAIMRAIWRMDEMQRRIQLDAIAISFLTTALVTFGWGFAEEAGAPRLSAFAVWPLMAVAWCAGLLVARRRYL